MLLAGRVNNSSLHVPSVAKVDPALVGPLVGSVLEGDDRVSGPQLFLRELTGVLLGLLGPDAGLAVLGGLATESLKADHDRVEILLLPEIHRLEELLRGHPKVPGRLQEGVDLCLNRITSLLNDFVLCKQGLL